MSVNDESAAVGEPIRCQLVPVPSTEYKRFTSTPKPAAPPLVLDMELNGAIRLTDPDSKQLVASTSLAEVTATPSTYAEVDDGTTRYTQPLLIVDVPSLQPLRIGAHPMGRGWRNMPLFRYGWQGRAGDAKKPAYVVTEGEWLTLVQQFGLGDRVVDEHASGEIQRRDDRKRVKYYAGWAFLLLVVVVVIIVHFVR